LDRYDDHLLRAAALRARVHAHFSEETMLSKTLTYYEELMDPLDAGWGGNAALFL
jgi:hypothetical protein